MNGSVSSAPLEVKVWGKMACFTRPENKVERVSYPVMTPSAARGVLEAIFWKPEFSYRVRRIAVLSPIRYTAILRNEVNSKAAAGAAGISITDDRAQRHSLVLTSGSSEDIGYLISADVVLRADVEEHPAKYRDQFRRRVERGQCFHRPYLGCREFSCDFAEPAGVEQPVADSRDLGLMLFDIAFGRQPGRPNTPLFFEGRLQNGVLEVPELDVRQPGGAQAMILQHLYRDADAILEQTTGVGIPPTMYLRKRIRWIVELDDGEPPRFSILEGEGKGGDRGLELLVPNQKRTSGVRPLLFADKTSYVLGIDADPAAQTRKSRADLEFVAFRDLARLCADETGEQDAARVVEFLETWDPGNPATPIPEGLTPNQFFTFRVNRRMVVDNPAVQGFWARHGRDSEEDEPSGVSTTQCLVSGVNGPVEEMMPVPVKGLFGGKSEMAIVSANAPAFESYGLKRAQTSPICRDAGERFGQALNGLLASRDHHALVQNATYVFWSPAGPVRLPVFDPKEVKEFLQVVRSGKHWYKLAPTSPFYLYGLVPNAARVAVRTAVDTTVAEIERRQADWFERLSVIGFDETGKAVTDKVFSLKLLAVSAYREFKNIEPVTEDALVRAALLGVSLPHNLLQLLVNRCRVEKGVTHPRAALLKYFLTQHLPVSETKIMAEEITIAQPQGLEGDELRAYHLGRLFAELEAIQSRAIPGINAGIADRFYGSACSTPASVFGLLLDGAQNHLGKLRKTNDRAFGGAQRRVEEILACVDQFPRALPLKSQALFSLGYYHHRAARRKAMADAAEAKKAGAPPVQDIDLTDPAFAPGEDN